VTPQCEGQELPRVERNSPKVAEASLEQSEAVIAQLRLRLVGLGLHAFFVNQPPSLKFHVFRNHVRRNSGWKKPLPVGWNKLIRFFAPVLTVHSDGSLTACAQLASALNNVTYVRIPHTCRRPVRLQDLKLRA
jgi:hypothetical protein